MTEGKWVIFIFLGIVLAVITSFLVLSKRELQVSSPRASDGAVNGAKSQVQVREYTDPAGFSFSYPDILTLEKKELDDATYSSIELVPGPGEKPISITVADSEFTSAADWLNKNSSATDDKTAEKLTLGDLDAIQVTTTKGTVTVAFDQNVLFTVTLPKDASDATKKAHSLIIATFSLKPPEIQPAETGVDAAGDDAGVEFEGEEVIE